MTIRPADQLAQAMIGEPNSRYRLPTPALILDEAALDANIGRMAERTRDKVGLRPHAKTHKCAWIARMQIEAGAVGICCAKIGEAEVLSAAGVRGILLTSPVADPAMPKRLCDVAAIDPGFACVVDHPDPVTALSVEACRRGMRVSVLIDVDVGLGRTGVSGPEQAVALAEHVHRCEGLALTGVQGYGGHWQHIAGFQKRCEAVGVGMERLSRAVDAIRAAGYPVGIVTGGGTGTVAADLDLGVLNEVQPGSYVFMDVQYSDALGADADGAFQTSLWVSSQVVSANADGIVTVDAGLKAFATDGPMPRPAGGRFGASTYVFFGDEHGALTRPAGSPVGLGERVEFATPHCDPTVDRYDAYHVVRGDRLVAIVPIEAARASR
ncbi:MULTISPECIES: DSD1 family PLP-dependent enzyme [unclassified Mycobacterium]|uniref:DSD1 family PLP-dependent enzyme n=1 Tax=unclassified Mycobacterium TaxID=2642494 RepID=UPI0006DC9CD8|nr:MULTISPECIES: DSD1 family PLP-dependent enzyme [unclassified Mycobacterium]